MNHEATHYEFSPVSCYKTEQQINLYVFLIHIGWRKSHLTFDV